MSMIFSVGGTVVVAAFFGISILLVLGPLLHLAGRWISNSKREIEEEVARNSGISFEAHREYERMVQSMEQNEKLTEADYVRIMAPVPRRQRVYTWLFEDTTYGRALDRAQSVVSVCVCIAYVVSTYTIEEELEWPTWLLLIDLITVFYFAFDFALRYYVATDRSKGFSVHGWPLAAHFLSAISLFLTAFPISRVERVLTGLRWGVGSSLAYIVSVSAIVDVFTVLPISCMAIIFAFEQTHNFVRMARVIRVFRVIRAVKVTTKKPENAFKRELYSITFTVVTMVFVFSCFFQLAENLAGDRNVRFHEVLYMMTIETFGRPNLIIFTTYGYLMMVCLVTLSVVLIPTKLAKAIEAWRTSHGFLKTAKVGGKPHLVLCGSFTDADVKRFLQGFFHIDHGLPSVRVVILHPDPIRPDMRKILDTPLYQKWVQYIRGYTVKPDDLVRARVHTAIGVIVLGPKNAHELAERDGEDLANISRAMAIRHHCPNTNLYIQCVRVESKEQIKSLPNWDTGDNAVICIEQFKMTLLGAACVYPGLCALISNLVLEHEPVEDVFGVKKWVDEYNYGRGQEIYEVPFHSSAYKGLSFPEAAWKIYCRFGAMLFAVRPNSHTQKSDILLNPGSSYHICSGDIGFVLTTNKQTAYGIAMHRARGTEERRVRRSMSKVFAAMQTTSEIDLTAVEQPLTRRILDAKKNSMRDELLPSPASSAALRKSSVGPALFVDLKTISQRSQFSSFRTAVTRAMDSARLAEVAGQIDAVPTEQDAALTATEPTHGTRDPSSSQADSDSSLSDTETEAESYHDSDDAVHGAHAVPRGIAARRESEGAPAPSTSGTPPVARDFASAAREEGIIIGDIPLPKESPVVTGEDLAAGTSTRHGTVLVCGYSPALYYFVKVLRLQHKVSKLADRHVIVLNPYPPDRNDIAEFENVFYVSGSALRKKDLVAAGVLQADRILVLTNPSNISVNSSIGEYIQDTDAILTMKNIYELRPDAFVVVDLIDGYNVKYLPDDDNDYQVHRDFAAGRVYASWIVDAALTQAFYTRYTLAIIKLLVYGSAVDVEQQDDTDSDSGNVDVLLNRVRSPSSWPVQSTLRQIPVPSSFAGKKYLDLVRRLVRHKSMVPLGLYRTRNADMKHYVYTNPRPDTVLAREDFVFILSTLRDRNFDADVKSLNAEVGDSSSPEKSSLSQKSPARDASLL